METPYLGVATDHVIESFLNRLWADYKTGAGIEPALFSQFHPLERWAKAAIETGQSWVSAQNRRPDCADELFAQNPSPTCHAQIT